MLRMCSVHVHFAEDRNYFPLCTKNARFCFDADGEDQVQGFLHNVRYQCGIVNAVLAVRALMFVSVGSMGVSNVCAACVTCACSVCPYWCPDPMIRAWRRLPPRLANELARRCEAPKHPLTALTQSSLDACKLC